MAEKIVGGKSEYAVYETRFDGGIGKPETKPPKPINRQGPVIPGSLQVVYTFIYTQFDAERWDEACDLYISFRRNDGGSSPTGQEEFNSSGPDYVAIIALGEGWIYDCKFGRMIKVPFQPVPLRYREASQT